jgi:cytochrome P450
LDSRTSSSTSAASSSKEKRVPPGILTRPDNQPLRDLAKDGNFYAFVKAMSAEFGDVVSLSPRLAIVSTSKLIKDMLRNTTDFRKADSIDTFKILVGEGLFTADGKIYDQQERVVKSAFGKKYFGEFRRIIEEEMTKYIDQNFTESKEKKTPVDIGATSVDLTMSIAARSFFGVGGETALARQFRKALVYAQDWFAKMQAAEFAEPMLDYIEDHYIRFPFLKDWQKTVFRRLSGSGEMVKAIAGWKAYVQENDAKARGLAKEMRGVCAKIIDLRRHDARSADRDDVLSNLLRFQKEPDNRWLTDELIIDQVATFFVAGHETTSDLFVVLLWKHARGETPKAVVDELRNTPSMIDEEQFLYLKYPATNDYITQVLLEHPPIVFTVRQATRDLEVGGYPFEEGKRFILAITSAQDVDVNFGFGRRQCIGRVFALEEAVIGLQHLVRHDLKLVDPAQGLETTQGLTIGYSRGEKPVLAQSV